MPTMQQWEFHELARATVERLLARVPAQYRAGFEAELDGGEYVLAVEELVLTLIRDQVPVAPAELDDLRRLLAHLRQPLTRLDAVLCSGRPEPRGSPPLCPDSGG
jgi:hypothetical protein